MLYLVFYYIAGFAVICLLGYGLFKEVYSYFDHCYWDKGSTPCEEVLVRGVDVDKVQYTKNNAKLKTTVYFYDGFRFVTFRTNREQHFISYDISVNKQEMVQLAIAAHNKAVNKLKRKGVHIYTAEEMLEAKKNYGTTPIEDKPVPQGGWRCPCGRVHQAYESSCVCGVSKAEAQNNR